MQVKGVILAAGYGSRFLPVTRVVPKELFPIVDRPAIDLVVEEMADAGIEDVLIINSRRKKAIEDWFDRDVELEQSCAVERLGYPRVRAAFVRQAEMKGTGHALLLARSFVGDAPFVVAYPDDLFGPPNCSAALIEAWRQTGCTALSAGDLTGEDVSRYGVLDAVEEPGGVLRLRGMIEKPPKGDEPSHLVSWGRYLYTSEIFEALDKGFAAHPGGREFYATDAINALAEAGRVVVTVIPSERFDTGEKLGYLQTVIRHALARPDLGDALRTWLRTQL